jgi:hypothetical protein
MTRLRKNARNVRMLASARNFDASPSQAHLQNNVEARHFHLHFFTAKRSLFSLARYRQPRSILLQTTTRRFLGLPRVGQHLSALMPLNLHSVHKSAMDGRKRRYNKPKYTGVHPATPFHTHPSISKLGVAGRLMHQKSRRKNVSTQNIKATRDQPHISLTAENPNTKYVIMGAVILATLYAEHRVYWLEILSALLLNHQSVHSKKERKQDTVFSQRPNGGSYIPNIASFRQFLRVDFDQCTKIDNPEQRQICSRVSQSDGRHTNACSTAMHALVATDGLVGKSILKCGNGYGKQGHHLLDWWVACLKRSFTTTPFLTHPVAESSTLAKTSKHIGDKSGAKKRRIEPAEEKSPPKRRKGRKAHDSDDEDSQNDSDDDNGGTQVQKRSKRSKKESKGRLACPYYQRMPHGSFPSRSCSGPGWDTAHRLK